MSVNLNEVAPRQRKPKRNRPTGIPKASQKVYVASLGKDIYYSGKSLADAEAACKEHKGAAVSTFGSRASVHPVFLLRLLEREKSVAGVYRALGGNWGTQSQNQQAFNATLGIIRSAFDTMNKARALTKKEPIPLPTIEEGEWKYVSTSTVKTLDESDVAELNELAEEFGDFGD